MSERTTQRINVNVARRVSKLSAFGFALLTFLYCSPFLFADLPLANYVFPSGGQRGTSVDVVVGGCNLNDECSFEFDGQGITFSSLLHKGRTLWLEGPLLGESDALLKEDYPKDYANRLTIADDAEHGIHHWRAWTSQGVTSTMKFVVGDLPETIEEEIEGDPIPVPVSPPVTINGRIFPREDVDVWTFEATSGQTITCEVNSARLGYPLIARLEVRDPMGRRVVEGTNNLSGDARIQFQAKETGSYQVQIHDIQFGGSQSHVYRLTVTQQPWVDSVFPLGGQLGSNVKLQLL
ncbi:MAG: hypothetical protein FJ267_00790, partial [Planctomycetes bacterium]|nr:hypothetical protein [Planctomycetota bacterium]